MLFRSIGEERERFEHEGRQPDLYGWSKGQFESEAGREEFWKILEDQITQELHDFAHDQADRGYDHSFFTGETTKGLRLLELMAQRYDVVVTNPTHYAVALKYETGMTAPVCVAKGVDALALKIRQLAGEADVPIVENPPLARALHTAVEVDEQIPPEHFRAVAEVIGYVLNLRPRASGAV